jgi:hypothetical protein
VHLDVPLGVKVRLGDRDWMRVVVENCDTDRDAAAFATRPGSTVPIAAPTAKRTTATVSTFFIAPPQWASIRSPQSFRTIDGGRIDPQRELRTRELGLKLSEDEVEKAVLTLGDAVS